MIGETVSHYRIIEKLGGGAMGVVYRAEDTHLDRDVAVKFLPEELTRDPEARDRFTLEARAASALDHANICTIYDIDETGDGRLFIAMAFYAGETIKGRLGRGPLPVADALDIARQIAAGLERAHEGGIVHRDIKPANVLVTDRGEVKILDFGIAKLAGEAGLTRTGQSLGTLAYMAPEQIEGTDVGPAADLWALGVVMYEMLTGALPFQGRSEAELVAAILARDPQAPSLRSRQSAEIPAGLDALVLELLSRDPARRPPGAGEVRRRLEELGRPVTAPLTPLLRRPTTWIAASATVLLLAAAILIPAFGRARAEAARRSLAEIDALATDGRYGEAYPLAVEAEGVLGGSDSAVARLMGEVSDILSIRSDPPGARVQHVSMAEGPEAEPTLLGMTPIVRRRIARGDHLLTITLEGHEPAERVASSALPRIEARILGTKPLIDLDVTLVPVDSTFADVVLVPGGSYELASSDAPAGATAELDDFFIDRYEVTNARYLEFVQAEGYAQPDLWPSAVTPEGPPLQRVDPAGRFRDRTGLPAPRDWTGQRYPDGRARHPVTGVTWYEAAAYCRWRGGALPTVFEWERAARPEPIPPLEGIILPWGVVPAGQTTERRANFNGIGTVPVDAHPFGISPFGAYAMAGNVREWTATPAEGGFVALGGSWRDPVYVFSSIGASDPLFSSASLGFRCVRHPPGTGEQGAGALQLARRTPAYEPVDEATYRSFLSHYAYDPVPLNAEIIETLTTEDWTREKIRFDGVDGDTVLAYLYLPSGAAPPYQTMVFIPGAGVFFAESITRHTEHVLGANIRSGRAALVVVLEGMVERPWPPGTRPPPPASVEFRNLMVRHSTELRRGLDYLESREDIDMDRLAYVGVSWGAGSRAVFAATDDRYDAAVFIGAGIDERMQPTVPEASSTNFIPHIAVPKLVVNGQQDEEHRWLTRGKPFWDLLSEPKRLELRDHEGHLPSLEVRVPAVNDFLDEWFGPVR